MSGEPESDLKRFGMSPERGFLPDPDPLARLPRAFAAWEALAADLPRLLLAARLDRAVAALPVLDPSRLETERELRRAMLVLSFLSHAAVWGGARPLARLPAPLAVPWCAVAQRLGRPPVLSYASYALDNWRRLDPSGPIALGNVALAQNFLGGADEDWFILVHVEIEARAAPLLRALLPAQRAAREGRLDALARALAVVTAGLEQMVASLQRMPEWCDPVIYYRRVRPFIHGWKDHASLPEGLVYEGVSAFDGAPQRFRGETGAQSGIVPALDAALGVAHADDPLRRYLAEMRDYMPPPHRAFVEAVEAGPPVRGAALAAARTHPALTELYESCLRWLESFRTLHLDYARRYIADQEPRGAGNPTDVGTGGTPFLRYLRKHRDETADARASDD